MSPDPSPAVSFNVLGSCVSRDILSSPKGPKYEVRGYVKCVNPLLIGQRRPESVGELGDGDIERLSDPRLRHGFYARTAKLLFNGGGDSYLEDNRGDWIIVDSFYMYHYFSVLTSGSGEKEFFQSDFNDVIESIVSSNDRFGDCRFERCIASLNPDMFIDGLCGFLKKNWGDRVIVLGLRPCAFSQGNNGHFAPVPNNDFYRWGVLKADDISFRDIRENLCGLTESNHFCSLMLEKLGCHMMDVPFAAVARDGAAVHYIPKIIDYLKERVDLIVSGSDTPENIALLTMRYESDLEEMFFSGHAHIQDLKADYRKMMADSDYAGAVSVCRELVDLGDAEGYCFLGRAYRDGKGVGKDLRESAEWLRKGLELGVSWARNDLFDTYWQMNDPDTDRKMVLYAREGAESGDPNSKIRLGRAYRDGRGVERDLLRAADCFRDASVKIRWVGNELFDVLWRIDSPESLKEMVSVAAALADKGDGGAMGRMGRAYRDGKGVPRDLVEAAEWMRRSADLNVGWAKNELFDILWKINTPESLKEMISVAIGFADKGDGGAMGRLGRAYREGKGVPRDLVKAAEWMRKARDRNVQWAEWELMDILWRTGTVDSLTEMRGIADSKILKMAGS